MTATFTELEQRRRYVLNYILRSSEFMHRKPELAEYLAHGYSDAVERSIDRLEELQEKLSVTLLPKDASDLAMVTLLRAYIPSSYWAELVRNKLAADFVPMLRLIEAAGGKPQLSKAQAIIKAELPIAERELDIIVANTLMYGHGEHSLSGSLDDYYFLGWMFSQSTSSIRFGEQSIRRAIDFFAPFEN